MWLGLIYLSSPFESVSSMETYVFEYTMVACNVATWLANDGSFVPSCKCVV